MLRCNAALVCIPNLILHWNQIVNPPPPPPPTHTHTIYIYIHMKNKIKKILHWLHQNSIKIQNLNRNFIILMNLTATISLKWNFYFNVTAVWCTYILHHKANYHYNCVSFLINSPVLWPEPNVLWSLSPCGLIPGLMGIRTQRTPQSTNKDTQPFITSDYGAGTRGYTNMVSNIISRITAMKTHT